VFNIIYNYLLYSGEKMQLIDGVCQKHHPLVFLAGLPIVREYATYVKFHTGCEMWGVVSNQNMIHWIILFISLEIYKPQTMSFFFCVYVSFINH